MMFLKLCSHCCSLSVVNNGSRSATTCEFVDLRSISKSKFHAMKLVSIRISALTTHAGISARVRYSTSFICKNGFIENLLFPSLTYYRNIGQSLRIYGVPYNMYLVFFADSDGCRVLSRVVKVADDEGDDCEKSHSDDDGAALGHFALEK